jgi:hypothetical protein
MRIHLTFVPKEQARPNLKGLVGFREGEKFDVTPPNPNAPRTTVEGIIARLTDETWWCRALRVGHAHSLPSPSTTERRTGISCCSWRRSIK